MSDILSKVPLKYPPMACDEEGYILKEENGNYCLSKVSGDPKDHQVGISLNVSANDYNTLKENLPAELLDKIELRREIAVMHEVMKTEGYGMIGKIDNYIDKCASEKNKKLVKIERYKLKYR